MANELGLGVIFYGKVAGLLSEISKLEARVSQLNRRFATFNKGLAAVGKVTQSTTKEYGNFVKAQDWINKSFEKGSIAHKGYSSTLKKVETSLTRQSAKIKDAGGDWKTFISTSDRLTTTQKVMAGELKIAGDEFKKTGFAAQGAAQKTAFLGRDLTETTKTTKKATTATTAQAKSSKKAGDEMGMYGRKIGQVKGGIQRLTAAMKVTASYSLAAAAIFGVINAFKQGISAIFEFDQALKNLQAITSATDAEIIVLEKVIKDVASTTKYSAQEVSDAAILIGQAGFTAAESIDAIQAVAMLATGTLSDMKTTADLVTTAVRAFGLEASDSGRIADIFASAVNRSKLTIDKIRTSFNYLGPIAHKAGLSLEETAAGMMVLANAGLRASTIGTGFRQVLARLVAPSDKLRTAFIAAGADLTKLNPAMSDMETIIGELIKVVPNAQKAFELFGLRGAAAVSALTESGVEGFQKMLKEVYRVGTATEMADKQMEGLGVMAKNLMDRLGLLAVAIGEGGIAGAFRLLLSVVRPIVSLLTELAGSTIGRVMVAVTSLTAVVLALKLAFNYLAIQLSAIAFGYTVASVKMMVAAQGSSVLMVALTALTGSLKKLWLAMLANPATAVIAIISLVVVSITTWIYKLSEATTKMEAHNIAIDKHIKSLESYKQQLSETEKGTAKYTSIIQRLLQDYPELAEQVNLTTMEFIDEGKALDVLISKKHDEKIKGLILLYDEYGKKIQRVTFLSVAWDKTIGNIGKTTEEFMKETMEGKYSLPGMGFVVKGLGIAWDKTSKTVGSAFDFLVNKMTEGAEKTKEIEALTVQQASAFKNLASELKQYGVVAGATIEDISEVLTKHTDKSEDEINDISKRLKQYLDETAEAALKNTNILGQLADGWAELYHKVDDARKKDVVEAWKSYKAKEAALIKEANDYADRTGDIKGSEEKLSIDLENLYEERIKNIAKRAGVQVDIKKRTTERELALIDSYIEQENVKYYNSLFELTKLQKKEFDNFKGTLEEKESLLAEMIGKEKKLHQDHFDVLTVLENRRIALARQVYKAQIKNVEDYYATIKTIAERSHDDMVDMLDTRLKRELNQISLADTSEKLMLLLKEKAHEDYYRNIEKESDRHFNELTKITNETYDAIETKIRTSGESAEKQEKELFEAKKKRNDEIKKLYQERADAYKKTIDFLISEETRLTGALKSAKEEREQITKEGDDLIRELGYKLLTDSQKWNEERRHADELMAKANRELSKGNITDAEKYAKEARGIYNGLAGEVKDISGNVIISVGETVRIAIAGVTEATNLLKKASTAGISALESELGRVKTKINEVGTEFERFKQTIQTFNQEAKLQLDASAAISALQSAETAVESYIAKLKSIPTLIVTEILRKYTTTGDSTAEYQTGGTVGGQGSGDIVPAMLEPGEFVEPKSAVKEYGLNFFEALRKKLISKEKIKSLLHGMQSGGFVTTSRPQAQKMQDGGQIQSSKLHTINLNINNKSHILYGEENVVDTLVKTLRRNQLVAV